MKKYIFILFSLITALSFSQNNCLDFDGTSDYVSVNAPLLPSNSVDDVWTFEVWLKTTSNDNDTVLSQYAVPNNNRSHINVDTTTSYWKFSTGYVVTSTTHVNDGLWHHIAVVKEGSGIDEVHLYVDGVLEDSGTDNTSMANENVEIGRIDNVSDYRYFPGQLDEMRIWNIARTQTEIQNNMNIELLGTEIGLVSYYNFNQGTAEGNNIGIVTLNDTTLNAYNATLNTFSLNSTTSNWITSTIHNNACVTPQLNMVSWWTGDNTANDVIGTNNGTQLNGVNYVSGVVDNAFLFDGVDDLILVPDSDDLNITGDTTLMLWVKRNNYNATNQTVICNGAGWVPNDEPAVLLMRFNNNETEFLFEDISGDNKTITAPSSNDGEYHHYTYIRENNEHRIYIDGYLMSTETFTSSPESVSSLPLTIGAQYHNPTNLPNDYDSFFEGEVDEINIFNRALSVAEIQSVFNAGSLGVCKNSLGIEENMFKNEISIFPNPVNDVLTIKSKVQISLIELYDYQGRKVLESDFKNEIFVNKFSAGMYFLKMNSSSGIFTKKIIIQ